MSASSARVSAIDSTMPNAPPMTESNTLSVEQLADQLAARRAERQPHGDLALPHEAARDQQVRHVRARDQQHEADHAISTTSAVEKSLRSDE